MTALSITKCSVFAQMHLPLEAWDWIAMRRGTILCRPPAWATALSRRLEWEAAYQKGRRPTRMQLGTFSGHWQRDLDARLPIRTRARGRLGPHSAGVAPPGPASPILRAAGPGRFGPAVCRRDVGVAQGHHDAAPDPCPGWQVKATELQQARPVESALEYEAACPKPLGLSC